MSDKETLIEDKLLDHPVVLDDGLPEWLFKLGYPEKYPEYPEEYPERDK